MVYPVGNRRSSIRVNVKVSIKLRFRVELSGLIGKKTKNESALTRTTRATNSRVICFKADLDDTVRACSMVARKTSPEESDLALINAQIVGSSAVYAAGVKGRPSCEVDSDSPFKSCTTCWLTSPVCSCRLSLDSPCVGCLPRRWGVLSDVNTRSEVSSQKIRFSA
jgi:hypothetical protein